MLNLSLLLLERQWSLILNSDYDSKMIKLSNCMTKIIINLTKISTLISEQIYKPIITVIKSLARDKFVLIVLITWKPDFPIEKNKMNECISYHQQTPRELDQVEAKQDNVLAN